MLDAYKRMQANGVIGPLMKVGSDGKPVVDMAGNLPGSLVARPFAEYPKALHRQRQDGTTYVVEVYSKSDELKLISESPDEDAPRSPLERERDEIAQDLATERKLSGQLSTQLENAMARIEQMAGQMEKFLASQPKGAEAQKAEKGFGALGAEAKAVANKT